MAGPKPRPDWHWKALALWARKVPLKDIVKDVGKAQVTVERALYSSWGREQRREIEARASESALAACVDPIVKAQAAAPRAMDRLIGAVEDAEKIQDVVLASKTVLDYAGYKPVERSLHVSVEAKIRNREALPDDVLLAFANGGAIPDGLKGLIALPAPESATEE